MWHKTQMRQQTVGSFHNSQFLPLVIIPLCVFDDFWLVREKSFFLKFLPQERRHQFIFIFFLLPKKIYKIIPSKNDFRHLLHVYSLVWNRHVPLNVINDTKPIHNSSLGIFELRVWMKMYYLLMFNSFYGIHVTHIHMWNWRVS